MPEENKTPSRRDLRQGKHEDRSTVEVSQPKGKFKDHFQEISQKAGQAKNQKQSDNRGNSSDK